jgi:hypothetical protein
MPPKNGGKAAGYSQLTDKATSHSTDETTSHLTKLANYANQVIG